jgi:hypothetical protein
MFAPHRPRPALQRVPIADGRFALMLDDALAEPEAWIEAAAAQAADFEANPRFAYPGPELPLGAEATAAFADFVREHVRAPLGARRITGATARLSIATRTEAELAPRQWFCHRDSAGLPAGQRMLACVIYLFRDEALGGTAFYRPLDPPDVTARLVHDAGTLDAAAFRARWPAVRPGYLVEGNAHFERVAVMPPRFNRAVFYDGGQFHTSHLTAPHRLAADPKRGRLTINGFFTATVPAA